FQLPPLCLQEGDVAALPRLAVALRWFVGNLTGVMVLVILMIAIRPTILRDPFGTAWLAVTLTTVPILLIQRASWWAYHWMLPSGCLAVALARYGPMAVEGLARHISRRAIGMVVLAALVPLFLAGGYLGLVALPRRFGISQDDRFAIRSNVGRSYPIARREVDWLREPTRRPGPIVVCGEPLIYLLSGHSPGTRITTWSLEMWPAIMREQLVVDLQQSPPQYLFLSLEGDDYEQLVDQRYPALRQFLNENYTRVRSSSSGNWYEHRGN
ncbi:MAG: hypothetical protein ACRCZF_00155, partial [Gemmataceae bacterium]